MGSVLRSAAYGPDTRVGAIQIWHWHGPISLTAFRLSLVASFPAKADNTQVAQTKRIRDRVVSRFSHYKIMVV